MSVKIDMMVEEKALREHGLLGRGGLMGNSLYAMDYSVLPVEAMHVIMLIALGGNFPYPNKDGSLFENRFGDLPKGEYVEFTVPTPGVNGRGSRRLVLRQNGMVFFTACHYERVQGTMSDVLRQEETQKVNDRWRNGFYVVTGIPPLLRRQISENTQRLFLK